jgi:hypothetical protein
VGQLAAGPIEVEAEAVAALIWLKGETWNSLSARSSCPSRSGCPSGYAAGSCGVPPKVLLTSASTAISAPLPVMADTRS